MVLHSRLEVVVAGADSYSSVPGCSQAVTAEQTRSDDVAGAVDSYSLDAQVDKALQVTSASSL